MGIGIMYMIIILIANSVGAISGMGGGVIIKPLFDWIGYHTPSEISYYSTVAVLTMAIVSTVNYLKVQHNVNINRIMSLGIGSVIGGILGNIIFQYLVDSFKEQNLITFIQAVVTVLTLILAFILTNLNKSYYLTARHWSVVCGIGLGGIASFLGIGGGPINVSLLILFFGYSVKESASYSIFIILFSQISKLLTIFHTVGLQNFDNKVLFWIIPAAFLGGLMGSQMRYILREDKVLNVFKWVMLFVIVINIYNAVVIFTTTIQ